MVAAASGGLHPSPLGGARHVSATCWSDCLRRSATGMPSEGTLLSGAEETVAIDWACAGHYAVGEEVGQTLSVASAFYDIKPADLPALDEALFTSYLAGLRDAGWRGDRTQIRFAYVAHAALPKPL